MLLGKNTDVTEGVVLSEKDAQLILESVLDALLTEDEVQGIIESASEAQYLVSNEIVMEKTIVRMDKKAKLQKALKTATFTIAREKKDQKFLKLLTIWRIERALEAYLLKKYHNEALRRAKAAVQRAGKISAGTGNKSKAVSSAIDKAKSQFNNK